jgi:hypothetical protein
LPKWSCSASLTLSAVVGRRRKEALSAATLRRDVRREYRKRWCLPHDKPIALRPKSKSTGNISVRRDMRSWRANACGFKSKRLWAEPRASVGFTPKKSFFFLRPVHGLEDSGMVLAPLHLSLLLHLSVEPESFLSGPPLYARRRNK